MMTDDQLKAMEARAPLLVAEVRRLQEAAPKCNICGSPATCFGSYESNTNHGFACDKCCGHGNEDGWCSSDFSDLGDYVNDRVKELDIADEDEQKARAKLKATQDDRKAWQDEAQKHEGNEAMLRDALEQMTRRHTHVQNLLTKCESEYGVLTARYKRLSDAIAVIVSEGVIG